MDMFLMDMFLMDSFKETHLPIAAWELGMCVCVSGIDVFQRLGQLPIQWEKLYDILGSDQYLQTSNIAEESGRYVHQPFCCCFQFYTHLQGCTKATEMIHSIILKHRI